MVEVLIFFLLVLAIVVCSYKLGQHAETISQGKLIEVTINRLIQLGYLKSVTVTDEYGTPTIKLVRINHGTQTNKTKED